MNVNEAVRIDNCFTCVCNADGFVRCSNRCGAYDDFPAAEAQQTASATTVTTVTTQETHEAEEEVVDLFPGAKVVNVVASAAVPSSFGQAACIYMGMRMVPGETVEPNVCVRCSCLEGGKFECESKCVQGTAAFSVPQYQWGTFATAAVVPVATTAETVVQPVASVGSALPTQTVCVYDGIRMADGDQVRPRHSDELLCTCSRGVFTCARVSGPDEEAGATAAWPLRSDVTFSACVHRGVPLYPGQRALAGDGCNSCECHADGTLTCTTFDCSPEAGVGLWHSGTNTSCTHDGRSLADGGVIQQDCNVCICRGGLVHCTTMRCSGWMPPNETLFNKWKKKSGGRSHGDSHDDDDDDDGHR